MGRFSAADLFVNRVAEDALDVNLAAFLKCGEKYVLDAPESLDLKEGEIKSKRGLIFHERGGGFFKAEEVEEKEKEKDKKNNLPKVISPPVVEKIPETQFRLSQGKGKEMVLLPKVKEGEIDLLMGNEDVNRKAYGNH